ncbi:uncharacterized protein LOC110859929 [Folsomia candida]|uniref:Secreted protein n=1 Tax=Folsomia candida TaxID=158441 RepID=A0A226DA01_FOLCA|nr:uncharacterized protein LOC110859929 [Folsomia candida]OXA41684.1 hypothetical protein Fcan01_23360 [Folsomia candida]
MSLASLLWYFSILVLWTSTSGTSEEDIPAIFMADELGLGAKGVMRYLRHLIEGIDNVGDLDEWVGFMETYLACEDAAWPYKSDQEQNAKTDLELINEFCTDWQKRWKCGNLLAIKLDTLYEQKNGQLRTGSDALRFSNSYVQIICEDRNKYLSVLTKNSSTHADKRSINCFAESQANIHDCVLQKSHDLVKKYNSCTNLRIIHNCFLSEMTKACPKSISHWINKSLQRIKSDLSC